MSKNVQLPTDDSGHAKAPDFSIPDAAAKRNAADTVPHPKAAKGQTEQPREDCPPWRTSKAIKAAGYAIESRAMPTTEGKTLIDCW